MGKKYTGSITTTGNFNFTASAPLDDRLVVETKADLTSLTTYNGIIVYVEADKTHYKYDGENWSELGGVGGVGGGTVNPSDFKTINNESIIGPGNIDIALNVDPYDYSGTALVANSVLILNDEANNSAVLNINLKNGTGVGSLQQKTFAEDSKNPKATGLGAVALGGFRGDKPNESPSTEDTTSTAKGIQSFTVGAGNHSLGNWSVTMGKDNKAYQRGCIALGSACKAGLAGANNEADYKFAFAAGENAVAQGWASTALNNGRATGTYSFAANRASANGYGSVAFGLNNSGTRLDGTYEEGEGGSIGDYAFSAGANNWANAKYCAVFGIGNNALPQADAAFVAGKLNQAHGFYSAVFGESNKTSNQGTFVVGIGNNTEMAYQAVFGKYNKYDTWDPGIFTVGCGTSDSNRKNAFTIWESGNAEFKNKLWVTDLIPTRLMSLNSKVTQDNSISFGGENNVNHPNAIAVGYGLTTLSANSAVFGRFNDTAEDKTNVLLAVGNGQPGSPSNAFEVLGDGRAKVYTKPKDDEDVVRLGDLSDLIPQSITGITVDSSLSSTSTNPVQNKVINSALNAKQDKLIAGEGITITGNTISSTAKTETPEGYNGTANFIKATLSRFAPIDDELNQYFTVNLCAITDKACFNSITEVYDFLVERGFSAAVNTGEPDAAMTARLAPNSALYPVSGLYIKTDSNDDTYYILPCGVFANTREKTVNCQCLVCVGRLLAPVAIQERIMVLDTVQNTVTAINK